MRSISLVAGPLVSSRPAVAAALASVAFAALACCGPVATAAAARNGLIAYEGRASANGYLYLRKPDGSRPVFVRATGRPSAPAVSPLGRRIAFSSGGQIWTVYVDGAALHQVTAGELHARAARATSTAWVPTGTACAASRSGARMSWPRRGRPADGSPTCAGLRGATA